MTGLLILLLVAGFFLVLYYLRSVDQTIEMRAKQMFESWREAEKARLEMWLSEETEKIRQEAVTKSRRVVIGQAIEQVIPYFPEFTYNPKEARFLGSPIDFLIFDGLDKPGDVSVVFLEIKTGESRLNYRERRIKNAIENGRVEWQELRVR